MNSKIHTKGNVNLEPSQDGGMLVTFENGGTDWEECLADILWEIQDVDKMNSKLESRYSRFRIIEKTDV